MASASGGRSMKGRLLRLLSFRATTSEGPPINFHKDAAPKFPEYGLETPRFHSPEAVVVGELPSGASASPSPPSLTSTNFVGSATPSTSLPSNTGNLDLSAILEATLKLSREAPVGDVQIKAAQKFTEAAKALIAAYDHEKSVGIDSTRNGIPQPILARHPPIQNVSELANNEVKPNLELATTSQRQRLELPVGQKVVLRSELEAGQGNSATARVGTNQQQISELSASSGPFPEPLRIKKVSPSSLGVHELDAVPVSRPSFGSLVRRSSRPPAERLADRDRDVHDR